MKTTITNYLLDLLKHIEIITLPVIAGIVKHILFDEEHSILGFLRNALIAGLGGYMAYLLLIDVVIVTDAQKSFIYGIIGLSSEIIFRGIQKLVKEFVSNPVQTIKKIKGFNKEIKK